MPLLPSAEPTQPCAANLPCRFVIPMGMVLGAPVSLGAFLFSNLIPVGGRTGMKMHA